MHTTALLALCWTVLVNAEFSTLLVVRDQRESSRDDIRIYDKRSIVDQDVFAPPAPFWYTYMDFGECIRWSVAAALLPFRSRRRLFVQEANLLPKVKPRTFRHS